MQSNTFFILTIAVCALFFVNAQQQRQRIALLGQALQPYQIERLMQTLIQGYLRAMGEREPERRSQVLSTLGSSEQQLRSQFERFVANFQRTPEEQARVSRLPLSLPWVTQWLPAASFDMRKALAIHSAGIARALDNEGGRSPRDRAYTVTAELLLMQHTCHWFCKSRNVASARVRRRHQTAYPQIIASVTPETRQAYLALVTGRSAAAR